jgi:hypothetical protein
MFIYLFLYVGMASEGRLSIHEAAFRNYDTVVERILANLGSKDGNKNNNDDDKE